MDSDRARTLNPALAATRFCPACGATDPTVTLPRGLKCPACDHAQFFNPKPVACSIPRDAHGRIVLLRRGFEPGKGLWTFPGGFVDLGEAVEDAARREAREELEVDVEVGALVGVYSRADDRIVLVVFVATLARGQTPRCTPEAVEVQAFADADVPWDELAFWSTRAALKEEIARRGSG